MSPLLSQVTLDQQERLFMMFKGEPGSGKSIGYLGFPKPLYIFDLDGRIRSLRNFLRGPDDDRIIDGITFQTFPTYDEFAIKLEGFQRDCPYRTIVIDGLTALARLTIRHIMISKGGGHLLTVPLGTKPSDAGGKRLGSIQVPGLEEFNGESSALQECLDVCRALKGVNIVWTAHVIKTEEKDQTNKRVIVSRSLLTGGKKVAAMIPGYFDEVYHFAQDRFEGILEYTIWTENTGTDFAKTALPLPERVGFTRKNFKAPLTKDNGDLYAKLEDLLKREGVNLPTVLVS
jgi:hypothetical protein